MLDGPGQRSSNRAGVVAPHAALTRRWLALLLVLCWPAAAEASPKDADSAWLRWAPPPECPGSDYILQQIEQWLGGPLPTDTSLDVATQLDWTGSVWEVNVRVAFDGHEGERRVAVAGCTDAADFVAVAVVLAVDPSLAGTLPLEGEPTEPEPYDPPPKPDSSAPETAPIEAPPEVDVPRGEQPPEASSAPSGLYVRGFATANAGLLWATLPETQFGLSAGGGVDVGPLSLALTGRFFPADRATPQNAVAPIDFSLVAARADVSYLWRIGGRARFGPALHVEGGAMLTEQRGPDPTSRTEPWLAAGAGANLLFALTQRVALLAELGLLLPLTQPVFVLSDGSRVHQVGPGGSVSVGVRVFFSEQ